jgi:DNA modification methylase
VKLWSTPGDTVLSPFAGVGSEGVMSLKLGRRFIGFELKPSYFKTAVTNLRSSESQSDELFDHEKETAHQEK